MSEKHLLEKETLCFHDIREDFHQQLNCGTSDAFKGPRVCGSPELSSLLFLDAWLMNLPDLEAKTAICSLLTLGLLDQI